MSIQYLKITSPGWKMFMNEHEETFLRALVALSERFAKRSQEVFYYQ